jgi:hypothetical protein
MRLDTPLVKAKKTELLTLGYPWPDSLAGKRLSWLDAEIGAVARLVGIRVGVVSGVFNLESPGVDAPGWRLRHEEAYHAA